VVLRVYLNRFRFFSDSGIFSIFSYFSVFWSFVASENEQAASKHEKNVVLGHFIKFKLFIISQYFLVTGGFGK